MQAEMQIPQQQAGARVAAPEEQMAAMHEEKDAQNFIEIDNLQEQGINVADIKKYFTFLAKQLAFETKFCTKFFFK